MTTETIKYERNGEKRTVSRSPKQRLIEIHLVCEGRHESINYNAHLTARKELSKNAFQLYDFLEFIPNGTIWALSSKVVYQDTALTEETYPKAFQELIDKGYLIKGVIVHSEGSTKVDTYHFYEQPPLQPTKIIEPTATPEKSSSTPQRTQRHSDTWNMNAYELRSIMGR